MWAVNKLLSNNRTESVKLFRKNKKNMSITKNKKISKNPDARYLVAEALTKLITKVTIRGSSVVFQPSIEEIALYILAEIEDAGISGMVWSMKEGVLRSDKSKQYQ